MTDENCLATLSENSWFRTADSKVVQYDVILQTILQKQINVAVTLLQEHGETCRAWHCFIT